MTRSDRERLIDRYLSGEMGSAEEQEFFIQVALNKELRQELKAQRVVESAIRKDRDAEPSLHSGLRSRVAAGLASAHVPEKAIETGSQAAPAAARAWWGGTGAQWLFGLLAAVAVAVGIVMILPSGERAGSPSVGSQPAGEQHAEQPSAPAATTPGATTPATKNPAETAPAVTTSPRPAADHPSADRPTTRSPRETSTPHASDADRSAGARADERPRGSTPSTSVEPRPTSNGDTVAIGIIVSPPKKR